MSAPLADEGAVRVSLGIEVDQDQTARIVMGFDNVSLRMDADQAEQLAVDLRTFAIELRNGGRLE